MEIINEELIGAFIVVLLASCLAAFCPVIIFRASYIKSLCPSLILVLIYRICINFLDKLCPEGVTPENISIYFSVFFCFAVFGIVLLSRFFGKELQKLKMEVDKKIEEEK